MPTSRAPGLLPAVVLGSFVAACSGSPEAAPASTHQASALRTPGGDASAPAANAAPDAVRARTDAGATESIAAQALQPSTPRTASTTSPPLAATPTSPAADPRAVTIDEHTVRTKAVELRVERVERLPRIGDRVARPGYEFVVVNTSWRNVIPLTPVNRKAQSGSPTGGFGGFGTSKPTSTAAADIEMTPTPYVVPMLARQMWLFTNGRFADTVDLEAEEVVADPFSKDGFAIAKFDDVVRGNVVFEAPANPKYQAFQFYDTDHGHALIPLVGTPIDASPLGAARQNDLLRLEASAAGAAPAGIVAPEGQRVVVVSVRGTSRSARDIVDVPVEQYVYAQTDEGCLSRPERAPAGLTRAFGEMASFPPTGANEGQLVFFVPETARAVRVLIRSNGSALDLPAPHDFQPAWPTPVRTIADGATLRLHLLPTPGPPPNLPPLQSGRAYQLLDVAVENLNAQSGVELQYVQLRLQASDGSFVEPSPLSSTVPCALPSDGVIPPATARRFVLVYDIPADAPARRVNYRGFQVDDITVDVP